MEAPALRQRKPVSPVGDEADLKHADGPSAVATPRLKHGLAMQVARSLVLAMWFNCCSIVIHTTQVVGAPLYFIKKEWFYAYMALTKESFGLVITALTQWGCPTLVRASGDSSVRGQLQLTRDGRLRTTFPDRIVLIANHQVYTDWIYLWWIAYTNRMHGHIFIILKESLKYIPIVGPGMMFYGFIFLARKWLADKPRLQHRLDRLKTSHKTDSLYDPMWLLIFPEGTNLSVNTKRRSAEYAQKQGYPPLKHCLLPRSTGLFFCLQQLKGTVDWVYDCTVAYEGPPKGDLPDHYFTLRSTYGQGRPPTSVNMHWRRFAVSEIPLEDQAVFDAWLRARWTEKDQLLDQYFETGRFPSDVAGTVSVEDVPEQQKKAAAAGFVEAHVRLGHWFEIGRIFMVLFGLGVLCMVLFGR